ncbi:MAG: cytochrome c3 family protein [Gammaproteobacteria bacterium]|nr:cytochrome c3 family protein [Gammaproteobacteria bacterium]
MALKKLLLLLVPVSFGPVTAGQEIPPVTTGAASGYVDDSVCGQCHVSHYETFQSVGMAQSFKEPENAIAKEQFGEIFHHEPSDRYYQITQEDDGLVFRRFQRDLRGNRVNEIEIPVDWILGSGNRTRSYLYQTAMGEMFQLPVGWYTEGQHWAMAPGFEAATHDGIGRKAERRCMFCHNAFPDGVEQDDYGDLALFPHDLPEGIGCQRCHGPGGEHVTASLTGADLGTIRKHIVNPAQLDGDIRESVCMQCHLLPAISIVGPRRFGRGDYSFRPGELLTDYMVHLDIREKGVEEPERFEINHHGYRFLKSACYRKSDNFTCTSCHNPHVKPESRAFRNKVAGVCRDCHNEVQHAEPVGENKCVKCHMPRRRTLDVVHVTMTDHWIARGPFDLEGLVEPVEPGIRRVTKVTPMKFGDPPAGPDAQAYRSLGAMRAGRSVAEAARALERVLRQKDYDHYEPHLDLAKAALSQGNYAEAEARASELVSAHPNLYVAHTLLGIARMAQGKNRQAIIAFRESLDLQPDPRDPLQSGRRRPPAREPDRAR